MRFLKLKVFGHRNSRIQEVATKYAAPQKLVDLSSKNLPHDLSVKPVKKIAKIEKKPTPSRAKAPKGETLTPVKSLCTKNIVKNYGKAICNFSHMPAAKHYIEEIIKRESIEVTIEEYFEFLAEKKDFIDSIQSFKELLLVSEDDSQKEIDCKKLFRLLGEVFIKYFSVNWIFNGRLTYKDAHLKFRHKMLRRLKNPELFTYIKVRQFNSKDHVELLGSQPYLLVTL